MPKQLAFDLFDISSTYAKQLKARGGRPDTIRPQRRQQLAQVLLT